MTLARQLHGSRTHAKGNDPNCPICLRHVQVGAALATVQAVHLSSVDGPSGSTLSFYALPGGRIIIVQQYANDDGFEIYRQVADSNLTAATINALVAYAGTGEPESDMERARR